MSRIGKLPISVPSGTTVTIEGQLLKAKGPKGELSMELPEVAIWSCVPTLLRFGLVAELTFCRMQVLMTVLVNGTGPKL